MKEGAWYIYAPDAPGYDAPILLGPFETEAAAFSFANALYPEDGNGNSETLQLLDPADF